MHSLKCFNSTAASTVAEGGSRRTDRRPSADVYGLQNRWSDLFLVHEGASHIKQELKAQINRKKCHIHTEQRD